MAGDGSSQVSTICSAQNRRCLGNHSSRSMAMDPIKTQRRRRGNESHPKSLCVWPQFLKSEPSKWPIVPSRATEIDTTDLRRHICTTRNANKVLLDVEYSSDWLRFYRAVPNVFQYILRLQDQISRQRSTYLINRGQSHKYLASPPDGVTITKEIYYRVVHSCRRLLSKFQPNRTLSFVLTACGIGRVRGF